MFMTGKKQAEYDGLTQQGSFLFPKYVKHAFGGVEKDGASEQCVNRIYRH